MADVAWSPLKTAKGEIKVGETVSREKLDIDKDEYNRLKEAGAIRDKPYPKDVGPNESVRERNVRKLAEAVREAGESNFADADLNEMTEQAAGTRSDVEVEKGR